jgi:hypothetical protein
MKALTLTQPWATLVAIGAKSVETRSWSTKHRGPLAIHAAKALPKSWHQFRHRSFIDVLEPLVGVNSFGVPNLDRLPIGCVLAVVNVVDVFTTEEIAKMTMGSPGVRGGDRSVPFLNADEYAFGDYSPGRYGWVFNNIRRLTQPFPYKGAQRIWTMRDGDAFIMTNLMPSSPLTREEAERAWKV